jgi:uncharacterized integral membrane protein
MFSIQAKLLIITVFVGVLVIFVLQNTESIPLVLFGSTVATLPVGIWILLAILAGVLTSFVLQLFNQSPVQVPSRREPERVPSRRETKIRKDEGRSSIPNINNKQEQKTKESPQTKIQDNINKTIPETETVDNKQDNLKKDTVYSYGYRKDKPKDVNKTDEVYDANYRVIIPPYKENEDQSLDQDNDKNEEEDWI